MNRLLFTLALAVVAWVISLITGGGRRQVAKIPEGMGILCQPPGKRYVLYALGVVVAAVVAFFSVLYILDGAPEKARPMWALCIAAAILTMVVTTLGGNMMARECVYFNGEEFQLHRAFRKTQVYRWSDVRRISGSFDRIIHLYRLDGTKILSVDVGMLNYDVFFLVLKKACPGAVADYYREQTQDRPKTHALGYGGEYFLMAGMGILILTVYVAMLAQLGVGQVMELTLEREPSQWFAIWFAPVCGLVSVVGLFICVTTSIRYSREKLVLRYPLRKKRELYWREIERVEMVPVKGQVRGWKTLRLYAQGRVYRLDLSRLSRGRDGFMTELFQMAERYEIPCVKMKK